MFVPPFEPLGIVAPHSLTIVGPKAATPPACKGGSVKAGKCTCPAGSAPKQIGAQVFPIARDHVAAVVLVTDDSIRAAQRALWDVLRIVGEPGGSAATAALLSGRYQPQSGELVAVLVSDGNTVAVDFDR